MVVGESHEPDWVAIERSEQFRELQAMRRRFVAVALTIFTLAAGGFFICTGYARGFMAKSVDGPLTVAYTWLLALTLLTWVIAWGYLRFSTRTLAPRAEAIQREFAAAGPGESRDEPRERSRLRPRSEVPR
jgi:uncharacterized membrane protein (DUF485 family)